jgi:hypothetical protein
VWLLLQQKRNSHSLNFVNIWNLFILIQNKVNKKFQSKKESFFCYCCFKCFVESIELAPRDSISVHNHLFLLERAVVHAQISSLNISFIKYL